MRMTSGACRKVLARASSKVSVGPHLALVYDASFVSVSELHRVFNGDDVTVRVLISVVDQCASEVDLPDPVPPTNRISPRFHNEVH